MSDGRWAPVLGRRDYLGKIMEALGIESIEELYRDIPVEARFQGDWDSLPIGMGKPLPEAEVAGIVEEALSRVTVYTSPPPFMGGGSWPHYTPVPILYSLLRGELLTSYTPYQPEISQGMLQALFEYQSLVADLMEMDVVNASMYDGASAVGEAFLHAFRVNKGRRKILVPETMNPQHLEAASLYVEPHGAIEKVRVDRETGYIDLDDLQAKASSGDVAAVYLQYPSHIGVVDANAEAVGEIAHRNKALYIMGIDPIAIALYKPPGQLGADIAVGDGQPLGLGMNYGGPSLGLYAVRWSAKLVRQMPGRLIGMTTDREGRRAYAMILQTREQHIRRAKATSNITTNQAFMAVIAAAYLAYMGGRGLRRIAEIIWYRTRYLAKRLESLGLEAPLVGGEVWRDLPVDTGGARFSELAGRLQEKGLLVGPSLEGLTGWLGASTGIIAVTEAHRKSDIDKLVEAIGEVLER